MEKDYKIFNLSLCKSGTSSLEMFLFKSYNLKGYPYFEKFYYNKKINDEVFINKNFSAITDIELYDFFSDIPFNLFDSFKYYEKKYKNSKFILIKRDFKDWLDSNKKWLKKIKKTYNSQNDKKEFSNIFHEYQYYGSIKNFEIVNENLLKKAYDDYHNSIFEYFKDKPNKLLVLNLYEINKENKINKFLNINILKKIKFPELNKNK